MIAKEFLKWNKAGGVVVKGLTNRRIKESALYFTK
jgi:GH24 family phage-related lysozyme (muramidase)